MQNVTCTTNQSMLHHESNNSNTCGTISTLDHQPLKKSGTTEMKKGSRQYRKHTIQNAIRQAMQELYQQILHKFTWDLDCYMKQKLGYKIIYTIIQFKLKLEHNIKNMGQILENACKYLMTMLQVDQYLYVHVFYKLVSKVLFSMENTSN